MKIKAGDPNTFGWCRAAVGTTLEESPESLFVELPAGALAGMARTCNSQPGDKVFGVQLDFEGAPQFRRVPPMNPQTEEPMFTLVDSNGPDIHAACIVEIPRSAFEEQVRM